MEYVFVGFRQTDAVRHYGFQGIAEDRSRSVYTVGVDTTLLRKYSIALQDVALICRRFLEEREGEDARHAVMLTEAHMRLFAENRAAVAASTAKRRQHRPPVSNKVGQAWRGGPR